MEAAIMDWPEQELLVTEEYGAAYLKLPPAYAGLATVRLSHRRTENLCFPSVDEASRAACLAVGELGGYSLATVYPATKTDVVTYQTAEDWFFN